jgi:eukaryotic-like serine/threonine-protein kinase
MAELPLVGEEFAGYRLVSVLGRGGMSIVFRAENPRLGNVIALKVLDPALASDDVFRTRFLEESRIAASMNHPNVIPIHDMGSSDGLLYIAMRCVMGTDLRQMLKKRGRLPAETAVFLLEQAARALDAAHRRGLVHRDVKPGNILIGPEGQVKLTDFGIAHAAGQAPVTGPGLVMGTTQYIAPERIAGTPATPASDLYSLGIVLHESLTGLPPYEGAAADVMAAHLYLPLPPLPADVPPELDDLVARLTAKDPARRISDAREVAALAASLRDSIATTSRLVPPARTVAAVSGPGIAVADQPTTTLTADQARGGVLARRAVAAGGADRAAANGTSDEWVIPPHMTLPVAVPGHGAADPAPGGPARGRRGGTLAVGAAVVASAGLIALLVSGAFGAASTADNSPAGPSSSTSSPAHGKVAAPGRSGTSAGSGSAGAVPGTGAATAPAAASPRAAPGGTRAAAAPSSRTSTSGAPGTSPAGTPGGTTPGGTGRIGTGPNGSSPASGTPGGTPSSPPTAAPGGTPGSPSATTRPTAVCVAGICL